MKKADKTIFATAEKPIKPAASVPILAAALIIVPTLALAETKANAHTDMTCPSSPNCVSSQAEGDHSIAPLLFPGAPPDEINKTLTQWLEQQPRVAITHNDANSIQAEFTSRVFGFVDDVTLVILPGKVEVRSASRTGYYDFGANRSRIEAIRSAMSN
ncbi:DUF1499 domain-containing protein [Parendozoicomonas haliclonae]|uniref:DUF1499 domain-containing protein n=1 Tax=Parendozoicomonas haliclonae TaxID=1960125 RepID=A0A1X7ALU8_9GAMM|nr:DUF1499 domain-containing protein [Parendozoicomonas haliclonae]SMA49099.1 hypothetical protein EHSB41UT_03049 [Parendozoicomonas haliclonae]